MVLSLEGTNEKGGCRWTTPGSFPAPPGLLGIGLFLSVALLPSCATTYLEYTIQPLERSAGAPASTPTPTSGDAKDEVAEAAKGDIPEHTFSFDRRRMLHSSVRRNGVDMEYFLLRREAMERVASRLKGGIQSGAEVRYPDFFYLWLRVFNYGSSDVRFDSYCFRLRNRETKRSLSALTPEAYEKGYDGFSLSAFPYYWSFEPKESHTFLHPVPDWYIRERREDTASDAEKKIRRAMELAWIQRRHVETGHIAPGEVLYAIVPFPQPEPDFTYSLEYDPNSGCGRDKGLPGTDGGALPPLPDAAAAREFSFPSLAFRIKTERVTPWEDFSAMRSREDERASRIWQREWREIEADGRDLYEMHRQYSDHEKLLEKEKKERGQKSPPGNGNETRETREEKRDEVKRP